MKKLLYILFLSLTLSFIFHGKAYADITPLTAGDIYPSSAGEARLFVVPFSPNVFQSDANGYTYCFLYEGDTYSGDVEAASPDGSCQFFDNNFANYIFLHNTPLHIQVAYVNFYTKEKTILGESNTFTLPFSTANTSCDYYSSDPYRSSPNYVVINIQNLCLQQKVLGDTIPDSVYYTYTTELGPQQTHSFPYDPNETEFTFFADTSTGNILYSAYLMFSCGGNPCGSLELYNNPQGLYIIQPEIPQINSLLGATINNNDTYTENGSFTDSDSSSWTGTVDYGDGSGTQPLALDGTNFSLSHQYTTAGTYTVTVNITDDQNTTGTQTATVTVLNNNQLTALSPAKVWVGLKNSDDVGLKFDLKAEAYKDGVLISSGQLNSFTGGSSGFNNAHLATIPFDSFSPVDFPSGSVLSIKVSVRNACSGSGHNSGTARLWYNDSAANSQFGSTIAENSVTDYLRDGFVLDTTTGSTKKTIDVASGAKCSAFKPFGTWTITP